jgi:two-component system catabolic regulation response regulator CreB
MQNKNILIIEDEVTISDVIEFTLKKDGFNIFTTTNGLAAFDIIKKNQIILILIDIGLPDIDGFELARRIKEKTNIPFIFLTSRSEEIDKILGFEIGADDYIIKPFSPRELSARIKALLKRINVSEPESKTLTHDSITINEDKFSVSYLGQNIILTRYEYRILLLLIKVPGKVFTRENIMNSIWEDPNMSLDRTIDTHVKTLRQKFKNINPDEEIIITHRGIGYSIKESE